MMLKKGILFGWLCVLSLCVQAQVTFIIESLPGATHQNDTLFLCGSFNNWNPHDKNFRVTRQLNGQLSVTVPAGLKNFEYKFTRGNWNKVETDLSNQLIPNRRFASGRGKIMYVQIENWLDLGGARKLNYIVFYFFACAFQALALCFLVSRITKLYAKKFSAFAVINGFMIVLLLLAVLHEMVNPVAQSYLVFAFHIAAFCWGPMMLYFFTHFYEQKRKIRLQVYFIPAALATLLVMLRIGNAGFLDFLSVEILQRVTIGNVLFIVTSYLFAIFTFIQVYRFFPFIKIHALSQRDTRASFLYYFYWISFTALIIIPVNTLMIISGWTQSFVENFHLVGVVLSGLIVTETYYLWRYPEIMKEPKATVPQPEDTHEWVDKLNALMQTKKPYLHPDLSVSDLADMLGTRPHVLSRVINDHHHKNFRDFVNAYRVEEFIALVNNDAYRHYTFLALAQEVGFNSKSTFNLAFKKLTRQNPREYFKAQSLGVTEIA